jgi:hypothetical protein
MKYGFREEGWWFYSVWDVWLSTPRMTKLARRRQSLLMRKKSILNKKIIRKIIRKTKPSLLAEYIERSSIPSSTDEVFI